MAGVNILKYLGWLGHDRQCDRGRQAAPICPQRLLPQPAQTRDGGMRPRSVDAILDDNRDILGRIKLAYGGDANAFAKEMLPLIRKYIAYVNVLPATQDSFFARPGGLARLGLETAFFALQATDSQIFAGRATISTRRQLEPRWRFGTFAAGLCAYLYRALDTVVVSDAHGTVWQPYLTPLEDWIHKHEVGRLFVRWSEARQACRSLSLFALPMILPIDALAYLTHDGSTIVAHMLAAISGEVRYHDHNVIDHLVNRASTLVIHRDLRDADAPAGRARARAYLARFLLNAMRELVQSHQGWVPNADRSRMWLGRDGLFLVWPNGISDVLTLLQDEGLYGLPASPADAMEILSDTGIILPMSSDESVWSIRPPGAPEPLEALKLVTPGCVLAVLHPSPVALDMNIALNGSHEEERTTESDTKLRQASATPPQAQEECPAPETPPDASDRQLSLPTIPPIPAVAGSAGIEPRTDGRQGKAKKVKHTEPIQSAIGHYSLRAPIRLNPGVAKILQAIVQTLNDTSLPPACYPMASGLFVPLDVFAARQADGKMALRALADANMLVTGPAGTEPVEYHKLHGKQLVGMVIARQFIEGLDGAGETSINSNAG
ncbi:MobH family relaxase [Janthinobacterium sp. BJB304]|uniref:MobH family relaxase n=1 Tax=Janthinobacterium sp. BJB304 TaxID=1572871 RepID=UPI000C10B356|nr:MobH family relaxase [Janthinobacterium sp. BJB304]PHV35863.1 relaxase [Janthinobacterium sp. BJB304]